MQGNQATREAGRAPIAILGVPFDNVTTAETLEHIGRMVASGKPHYLATANVDFLVQASEDVELRRILFDAHLVLADGMPIVWASRMLGNPLPERVTGSGMVPLLLELAEHKGWKVYFLGGTEQSVAAAAARTREKHPKLQLVGAYSPPFKPLLEMDHEDLVRRLQAAKPDLLLVAFGCPKQEKWINMNYRAAGVPVSIGVGATIDFLAGTVHRAPVWMQRTGTEWLFRLGQEPRRLFRRYFRGIWVFGRLILRQLWQLHPSSRPARPGSPSDLTADLPGSVLVKLGNRLDAPEVQARQQEWLTAVQAGSVILDLSETQFVDSTGMGALIKLRKLARELQHPLVLAAPGERLTAALRLMKLEGFFTVEATVTAARLKVREKPALAPVTRPGTSPEIIWNGEVTAVTAEALAKSTEAQLEGVAGGVPVVINLAKVSFVDSTGIGLMVRLRKSLWRRDIPLTFTQPGEAVLNVLRHTKMDSYLLEPPR